MEKSDIFVGRSREIEQLKMIMDSPEAEFVVVYGRRRVGKTFLVNSFFKDKFTFKLTGLALKDKREQLRNFSDTINQYCGGKMFGVPDNWYEAFDMLKTYLQAQKVRGKKVVFIDELPWIDTRGSNLVSALEHFWNDWASTQNNLVLIVCGSATSWISKKILKDRGGLHNRVTQKIYIHPFRLAECRQYLKNRSIVMTDKEIAECYMIMGGIPFYLKKIVRGKSLAQNIDEIFFSEHGSLCDEFSALYASLFSNSENYIKIVETLSKKNKGLTRDEILAGSKLVDNGHFSAALQDLIDCEFVRVYRGYGKTDKMGVYQLIDPFTLFYFKFMKKLGTSQKSLWQSQIGTAAHNTWAGLAFEMLCLNHHFQIEQKLGVSGVLTNVYSWISAPDADEKAQIDLIIKRGDKIVNVCEMKFYEENYKMKKSDYDDIQRKVRAFRNANSIRWAIHPVLVTAYQPVFNEYLSVYQNIVELKDLFV